MVEINITTEEKGMKNNLNQQNKIKKEVLAGCTTFVASVYIIITNALILSDAGISQDAAMMATILTSAFSTILMGLLSDTPFVLVPGMGINSLFTYTIVHSMGLYIIYIIFIIFPLMPYPSSSTPVILQTTFCPSDIFTPSGIFDNKSKPLDIPTKHLF